MRADDVRFAALECNEPAQRADVAGRDLEPGGLGAELVVEHADAQVVAAGEQDGVVHLVERPEQFHVGLDAGVQSLVPRRDAQHTVGLDHRGNHARAAADRGGDQPAAHAPQVDAHELFQPQARGNLARQHGRHFLRFLCRAAQVSGNQLAQHLLTDDDCGDRIAGQADDRRAVDHRQNGGLAGHDVDAVHKNLAQRFQDAHREIVLARGRARDDDHDVVLTDGVLHAARNQRQVVGNPRQPGRRAAPFLYEGRGDARVELDDAPGCGPFAGFDQLGAGRKDPHPRRPDDRNLRLTRGQQGAEIVRAQLVAARQQRLGRHDVFADQPHVLPRRRGVPDFDLPFAGLEHPLDHDDGIGPAGQRIAGVHVLERRAVRGRSAFGGDAGERERGEFAGAERVLGANRDAVHGRAVVVRGRPLGEDRRRGRSSERVFHRNVFRSRAWGDRAEKAVERGAERLLLEVAFAGGAGGTTVGHDGSVRRTRTVRRCHGAFGRDVQNPPSQNSMTSTSSPASRPSSLCGMQTMPSACTRLKIAPDFPGTGRAVSWPSASRPSVTRT